MKKVRIGIIGLGSWGMCHLEACRSLPSAEVAAVCDIREEHLQAVAERYHIPHRYTDSEALLDRDDLDLIAVATLERDHLPAALQALRSGKHVLVEKPVALRHEEAALMLQEGRRHGLIVAAGHVLRFEPRYAAIRQAIAGGQLGSVKSMYFRRSRTRSMFQTYKRIHTAYETSVHDVDLAIWYAGSRVKNVRAFSRNVQADPVPDLLWSCLEFENGAMAMLQSNWATPDAAGIVMNDAVEIIGDGGSAQFDNAAGGFQFFGSQGRSVPDYTVHQSLGFGSHGALRDQYAYLCRMIQEGLTPEHISFEDAVHGIEVVEAIVGSAASGRDVRLG